MGPGQNSHPVIKSWGLDKTATLSLNHGVWTKRRPLITVKFWSVSLYDQRIPRYRTSYNSPLTTMLTPPPQKKKNKKCQKIQNFNFHYSFTTLIQTLPRSIHIFWEQIWCALSEEISFETFTPYGPICCRKGKYLATIQNFKFHNSLNNFSRDPPQEYA